MSLVIAAMEMSRLMWRVRRSTSWVLPAPTGPPMPILMGSDIFFSRHISLAADLAHEHSGALTLVPHLRYLQSGADGPEVGPVQPAGALGRGSDVVGRLPQQPLAGVLPQRDGPDGVLRQGGDRGEQVGGEGLGQRDTEGTGDDGERQRLVAGGAAGTHQL